MFQTATGVQYRQTKIETSAFFTNKQVDELILETEVNSFVIICQIHRCRQLIKSCNIVLFSFALSFPPSFLPSQRLCRTHLMNDLHFVTDLPLLFNMYFNYLRTIIQFAVRTYYKYFLRNLVSEY